MRASRPRSHKPPRRASVDVSRHVDSVRAMFTIIGGDGQEYGPATAQQIRGWIAAGRANLDTKARAVGSDEWQRLGDFLEFAGPGEVPPPLFPASAAVGAAAATADVSPALRLLARMIDWAAEFLCSLPGMVMLAPLISDLVTNLMRGEQPDFGQLDMKKLAAGGVVFGLGWLAVLVTQILLLSLRGQSLGKLVTRLRVVRIDGSKAGFVHAWLLREALITCGGAILSLLPFVGPLFLRPVFHLTDWCLIFRRDHRCLHDLIAGTRVVKV